MNHPTIEAKARKAIAPLMAADESAAISGRRSKAGGSLPPYYLVYFLLVKLLGFKDMGRWEKVAWAIPATINGTTLMIEYRKMGLGIFIKDAADEAAAEAAAKCLRAGVRAAEPYFESLADAAAKGSELNVNNKARELSRRFAYFADRYAAKTAEAETRKDERIETAMPNCANITHAVSVSVPSLEPLNEARWYATAAIEAFYSWTEHVFILAAILKGKIATGEDVADLAEAKWDEKFNLVLDINDADTKNFYDRLITLRRQVRNFVAHGAFGKDGQALNFHSSTGAVPVLLPLSKNKRHFTFGNGVDFLPPESMQLVHNFITHMWSGDLSPAKIYIESGLPLILSNVGNGEYAKAMTSDVEMTEYTEHLCELFGNAANMDW
jgi:hypothetical protein